LSFNLAPTNNFSSLSFLVSIPQIFHQHSSKGQRRLPNVFLSNLILFLLITIFTSLFFLFQFHPSILSFLKIRPYSLFFVLPSIW
jgi:hypothetical protein